MNSFDSFPIFTMVPLIKIMDLLYILFDHLLLLKNYRHVTFRLLHSGLINRLLRLALLRIIFLYFVLLINNIVFLFLVYVEN